MNRFDASVENSVQRSKMPNRKMSEQEEFESLNGGVDRDFCYLADSLFSYSPEDIDKGCSAQLDGVGKGGLLWENIHVFRTSFRKLDFSAINALRPNYQNSFKAVIELQKILEMATSRLKDSEESWHLIATDMREKLKSLSDWERTVELEELKEFSWSWLGDRHFLVTRSKLGPVVHMLLDTPAMYSQHKRLIASDLIKMRTLVDDQYIRKNSFKDPEMDELEKSASMLEAEHENYEQLDKDRVVATTQYHEAYERYIQCRHLILKELHALSQAGQLALFRIRRALTGIEEVNNPAGLSSP